MIYDLFAPIEFGLQGFQETVIADLYHFDRVRSALDMQTHIGTEALAATIDRDHIRVIPAADSDINRPFVRHDNRPNGQAMRRNRRKDHTSVLRHQQRSSDREVIRSTAGRRGDDQTIGMIGMQQFSVHFGLNGQHVCQTLFEDSNLVQRIGRHH